MAPDGGMGKRSRAGAAVATAVIEGAKGGGGKGGSGSNSTPSPISAVEAPNTLRSKAVARVIDLLSEGPIVGLVDGAKSIFLDGTPLQEPDGGYNFEGLTYQERTGTPDQDPLKGFDDQASNPVVVGVNIKQATPAVRQITNPNLDRVKVIMRFPQMTSQDTSTGDINGTSVRFKIEIQPFGGAYQEVHDATVSGKCTSPYERTYNVELPEGGAPWNLRVTRMTADSSKVTLQNETIWATYTEHVDQRFAYPDSAFVAIEVDSQQFGGNVPRRAYEIKGLMIRVPSNYNPETREYTGLWDGTFQTAWTDNPAWVLFDLLTNRRYGLGEWLDDIAVDKWAMYAIGQYCDELVPDGFGGQEPRFTFNGLINTQQEAFRVIQSIAATMRTMTYWGAGTVSAVVDGPDDPVMLVTQANVADGEFVYQGSGLKARHTAAFVNWNDPDDGFEQAVEVVEDQEGINRFGYREIAVGPLGVTSRGQARRVGKWLLDTERHETETVVYTAGLDHYAVRPGDIVSIADPFYAGLRIGGRIAAATAATITLDAAVTLEAAETYQLAVMQNDGTLESAPVITGPGTHTTLELSPALSAAPNVNNVWVLLASNVQPRPFRVLAIRETEKNMYEVTAVERDITKFARIEQGLQFEPPPYSTIPVGPLSPPTELTWTENLYDAGGHVKSAVTFSWSLPADPRANTFECQVRYPSETEYTPIPAQDLVSIDILDTHPGTWGFRVRAVDGIGRRSRWLGNDEIVLQGLLAPPADVPSFKVRYSGGTATLTWERVDDLDVINGGWYHIRFTRNLSGYSWGSAQNVVTQVPPTLTTLALPAAVGVWLIKAFDRSGVQSQNATVAFPTVQAIEGYNVVEVVREDPAWAGVLTNCIVEDGRLKLADPANEPVGYYEFANLVDLGERFISLVTSDIEAFGENLNDYMAGWVNLTSVATLSGADPADWQVTVEISLGTSASGPWGEYVDLLVGDYQATAYRFRLRLETFNPNVTPSVGKCEVEVDMPDRVAGEDQLMTSTSGFLRVLYDPAFKERPVLGVTTSELKSNEELTLQNMDAYGFDIAVQGPGSRFEAKEFQYIAKGYGRRYDPV